jgi:hypothetical protein
MTRDATRSKGRPTGPRNRLGRPAWAHPGPVRSLLRPVLLPRLLDPLPFCMWALVVGFSPNWTKLLVLQDSTLFWLGPQSLSSSRAWSLGSWSHVHFIA